LSVLQGLPGTPQAPIADQHGNVTAVWYSFFINLFERTGGATGGISASLDTITSLAGSILFRGASVWQGLNPAAQFKVLRMGAAFPEWDTLDGNSFGEQVQNTFFAAPATGSGNPSFRTIAGTDLDDIAGQYPGTTTNGNASAGNVGEYMSSSASSVSLVTATPKDIATLTLTAGDWDVWGTFASVPAGTTTQTLVKSWINTVSATDPGAPNNGAYVQLQTAIAAGLSQVFPIGSMRVTVANGDTQGIFLSADVTFATSTLTGAAFLGARRRR
jgi:hypothetical protein